ncbi:mitochondrial pyruvate carrier [Radiomyces spectabilis]|uniref:mitochondrial pyruvate carrier n=1 Tax=Radiomyces spectabilis TaxID=64574 RepID=UPI002220F942|nr:mitochondrial pyruvate carrier [Radiomyces spectabilis]KAI8393794.1 mitochondrial pyruvate carrier [Radiomyces spectabilis]
MASSAASQTLLQRFINSPTGPKTIHFWAPAMKWGLVFAGIGDFTRPADKLSLPQNVSLMMTGAIWSRWSMVIIPKNWSLLAVNAFLAATGATQVVRILKYQQTEEYRQKQASDQAV